jgi:molecular chaperone Hsp33
MIQGELNVNHSDQLIRAMTEDKALRIVCARTTELVNTARRTHNLTPGPAAALGRMLTIGVMMGLILKDPKDRMSIIISGNGPVGKMTGTFNNRGTAKGFVSNTSVEIDISHPVLKDMLLVGQTVGCEGLLTVTYDIGLKRPYVGRIELISGEVDTDLACYLHVSDQQPSVVRASEVLNDQGEIVTAGGILIQMMPNTPADRLSGLESRFTVLDQLIRSGISASDMLKELFSGEELVVTDSLTPMFKCDCSKERMREALSTVGVDELKDILQNEGHAQVECHFCRAAYGFDQEELISLIDTLEAGHQ